MTRNEGLCVSVCTDLHYYEGVVLCVCVCVCVYVCVTMFMHVCSGVLDMAHLWTVALLTMLFILCCQRANDMKK